MLLVYTVTKVTANQLGSPNCFSRERLGLGTTLVMDSNVSHIGQLHCKYKVRFTALVHVDPYINSVNPQHILSLVSSANMVVKTDSHD